MLETDRHGMALKQGPIDSVATTRDWKKQGGDPL